MTRVQESLSIGRFARLSGLSIGALRHYDELDLLRPARVDAETGYRLFERGQLDRALTIARLRNLEMPLEEIRAVLDALQQAIHVSSPSSQKSPSTRTPSTRASRNASRVEGQYWPVSMELIV